MATRQWRALVRTVCAAIASAPLTAYGADAPATLAGRFAVDRGYEIRYYAGWTAFWILCVALLSIAATRRDRAPQPGR